MFEAALFPQGSHQLYCHKQKKIEQVRDGVVPFHLQPAKMIADHAITGLFVPTIYPKYSSAIMYQNFFWYLLQQSEPSI
jgi:hypothetical protein